MQQVGGITFSQLSGNVYPCLWSMPITPISYIESNTLTDAALIKWSWQISMFYKSNTYPQNEDRTAQGVVAWLRRKKWLLLFCLLLPLTQHWNCSHFRLIAAALWFWHPNYNHSENKGLGIMDLVAISIVFTIFFPIPFHLLSWMAYLQHFGD